MQIYQYTGGTDFARFYYCAVHIGVGADGTLYRIRGSGAVSHLVNGAWISDPSAGGNGTPVKIAVGDANNVWLVTSTGVIKTLDYANTGNFVVVPGWASDITTSGDPTNGGNEAVYVIGATQSGANVYKYSSATGATNGSWTLLNGVLDKIASAGYWQTVGVRTGTSSVYHLNSIRLSLTAQTTGYYDCNVFPNGCPAGSFHTATVNVTWKSKGVPANGSSSGSPATTLNAIAYPYTEELDPIFGDPNSPECQVNVAGAVQCSVMGLIFSSNNGSGNIYVKIAWTKVKTLSGTNGNCNTTPICSNTSNPACPFTFVYDTDRVCHPAYTCEALAVRLGGFSSPCWPNICIGSSNTAPGYCTPGP